MSKKRKEDLPLMAMWAGAGFMGGSAIMYAFSQTFIGGMFTVGVVVFLWGFAVDIVVNS